MPTEPQRVRRRSRPPFRHRRAGRARHGCRRPLGGARATLRSPGRRPPARRPGARARARAHGLRGRAHPRRGVPRAGRPRRPGAAPRPGQAIGHRHPLDLRPSEGDSPRLVQEHGPGAAEPLDHACSLDGHAPASGTRDTADERDRGGQNEGARGGDDEDGEGPNRVAAHGPGRGGHGQCDRQEDAGIPIREPRERRLFRLGGAHQPDQGRLGTVGRRAHDAGLERLPGVHRAAPPWRRRASGWSFARATAPRLEVRLCRSADACVLPMRPATAAATLGRSPTFASPTRRTEEER
jgi:hypothetical protein